MKIRVKVIFPLCLFLFTSPCFSEQWLCITEHSAGIKYEKSQKKWRSTRFTVEDDKFIIAETALDNYQLEVRYEKSAVVVAACEKGINSSGYLLCDGFANFKFNKNNGRFVMTFDSGYWLVSLENEFMSSDEESESLYINIGNCTIMSES